MGAARRAGAPAHFAQGIVMSSPRRTTLALAVAAGLALTGTASAVSLTVAPTGALPEGIAYFDVASNSTQIGVTPSITVNIDPSDNIIGRTTGFALRVTLAGGALFGATPTITAGGALPGGWTTSIGAGGAGSSFVVINFNPPSTSPVPGITNGPLVILGGAGSEITPVPTSGHVITNAAFLQTSGQTVTENYQFFDPVSTTNILNPVNQTVLQSGNPVVASCQLGYANPTERIDVGANASHPSRTYFSNSGAIGALNDNQYFSGAIFFQVAPGFSYFSLQPTDQISTTVNGSFSAFAQSGASVVLTNNPGCVGSGPLGTIAVGGNPMTFNYTLSQIFLSGFGAAEMCFRVPTNNVVPIQATTIAVQSTFTRNSITAPLAACNLQPMQYNGPVVKVYTFNPAGNTTQQSFLRISDTGPAGGQVTITGIDDAGNPGVGPVSFNLGAGQSIQLTADDLQNGNAAKGLTGALGAPAGKWRLTVTSYFPNLVVTSLNRNNTSGTVSNLTNYDVNGKQNTWGNNGDNGN